MNARDAQRIRDDVAQKLSAAEEEALLEDLMDDGELFEARLAADRAVAQGLLAEPEPTVIPFPSRQPRLAMAASFVIGIGAALLLQQTLITSSDSSGIVTATYQLHQPRSAETGVIEITLTLAPEEEWITLVSFPKADSGQTWLARVQRLSGDTPAPDATWQTVWTAAKASRAADGYGATLHRSVLTPGVYRLQLMQGQTVDPDLTRTFRILDQTLQS